MSVTEWLTLAGIVIAIGSGFAIPAAVWMTKMWSSLRVLNVRVRGMNGRIKRLETLRTQGVVALADQQSTLNDRVNEHAEDLADYGARILTVETEVKDLRVKQHASNNAIAALQNNKS